MHYTLNNRNYIAISNSGQTGNSSKKTADTGAMLLSAIIVSFKP